MAVLALLLPALLGAAGGARGGGGLLVARGGCRGGPAAFRMDQLLAHAAHNNRDPPHNYTLLSYEETCGPSWRESVARAALATQSAGGAVVVAGWGGPRLCLLAAGGGQPGGAGCGRVAARGALAGWLAARLRWRRALLPPSRAAPACECRATLRAAARALAAAGLAVRRALLSDDQMKHRPHVVVACEWSAALHSLRSSVLLLHLTSYSPAGELSHLDFSFTTLDPSLSPMNTSSNESAYFQTKNTNTTLDMLDLDLGPTISSNDEGDDGTEAPIQLLLSDEPLNKSNDFSAAALYNQLLDEIELNSKSSRLGVESVLSSFHLYEWQETAWRHVAVLTTEATRRLDDDDDWTVVVRATNSSDVWQQWRATKDTERGWSGALQLAGYCVGGVLVVLAAGGVARAAARRRRGARRRGDVVLSPADFSFPAEEPRRVPDGMESMLCWLQQLHEFTGPELERPDLLKQPAPAPALPAPAPPSAPSSTASGSRLQLDRRTRYKGDPVQLKSLPLPAGADLELKQKAIEVLLVLHNIRHENLNPFIGCLCSPRGALVWDWCGRGSLEDVLRADAIRLEWPFRLSLLTDLARGLRHLHACGLTHGRLTSRNCVVDSRWVLRLTDYGLPDFYRVQNITLPPRTARDLLWTAPELLRAGQGAGEGARGTPAGDVYSFAIVMQEVIVRGEPYCMLALSPEDIVEKLCRPPPLIRPSVSMGAAPPEAVSVMRQCWAELPDLRPRTDQLIDIFRLLHRGRKVNIVDSMFEMLEKYSNNLEELIKERTEQLDMEKKKTEQLLNRMLPRSVAERLVLGLRVEPEEFSEVSIYFSDIVGFTELAARSTPVQVVALLNDLYTTFDAAIEQYNVYKVETIGDAYMVVGGLPARAHDHAQSVATMALHLLSLAGSFRVRHLPARPLHVRIGLHSGPCCAGVVGLTMPRYCLFGDTVNTASRMESTGAAWRIQVSSTTAARLQAAGGFRLRSRGLIQIKGKGAMHTYWLLGKDGFDKPLPTPPPLPSEETLLELEAESEPDPPPPAPAPPRSPAGEDAAALPHTRHKYAWQRSGAMSADSSPPGAGHTRYRCRGGAGGVGGAGGALRRQWSLERGEALAAARARSPPSPRAAPAPRPHRYRTRPDPAPPSASFD